jgi:hypothetical protein
MTPDGRTFEDVLVVPAPLMPTAEQRQALTDHLECLRSLLLETPALSVAAETHVATTVSKLLTVLPGERKSDLAEEARSEVHLEVLEDVPWWGVELVKRLWFKHDCGTDERGKAYDYRWAPDPGTLRKIALRCTYPVRDRIKMIERMLGVREYTDCTAQLVAGRTALAGLNIALKAGNLSEAGKMTFDQAVQLGASSGAEKMKMPAQQAAE